MLVLECTVMASLFLPQVSCLNDIVCIKVSGRGRGKEGTEERRRGVIILLCEVAVLISVYIFW